MKDESTVVLRSDSDLNPTDLTDLCGLSVGVVTGDTFDTFFTSEADQCADAGRPAWKVVRHNAFPESALALKSGRVDAYPQQAPLALFAVGQDKGLKAATTISYKEGLLSATMRKDDTELQGALQKVLQEMVDDGTYVSILKKWELEEYAVERITLNAGTV
jgi:polar amino acid transport system substrate-binding protein